MESLELEAVADSGVDEAALVSLRSAVREFAALGSGGPQLASRTSWALDAVCRAIKECERSGISRREIQVHLVPVRTLHAESPFIARAQTWPRGYPGDFETIEYLCEAVNHAPAGSVGHALEGVALTSPITDQHRNKVRFQAEAMLDVCERQTRAPRILSIGCGGCRDIRSVAEMLRGTQAQFVLCDLDYDALDFALHALGPLAERCTYLNATIPRVLPKLLPYGPFDLAIAGGVFDYLPDRWVTLTLRRIWESLLGSGGELLFTNIRRGNPHRVWLEYLADWELRERDEADILHCCADAGIPAGCVEISSDATGLALLVRCRRGES